LGQPRLTKPILWAGWDMGVDTVKLRGNRQLYGNAA
jgi:hypothetical protein